MSLLSFTLIAVALFWIVLGIGYVAFAYLTHRAYLRMFDRPKRLPFSLRCALGWHKDDNLIAVHNGFDLLRCSRCDRPTMRRMPK